MSCAGDCAIEINEETMGTHRFEFDGTPELLFTDNDTNMERLYVSPAQTPITKTPFTNS